MSDKINIIVERDGEFHKFNFDGKGGCKNCSLLRIQEAEDGCDACDICMALDDGHFEKVEMN
jgi:hypothetical protein